MIDRYELVLPLGAGGMAQVWLAHQRGPLGFTRTVAVKVIRPDIAGHSSLRAMFLDEARLAAQIRHPNVVEVCDLGEEDGLVYQVMTLVEGASLNVLLAKMGTRLPTGMAIMIVTDMLRGLHAAHELAGPNGELLGVVHRDVSPHNVLVGIDGVAKLSDFGIALAKNREGPATRIGGFRGKVRYAAPEHLLGDPASPRSDLFSAGVVAWEALTGKPLFLHRESIDEARVLARVPAPDPRTIVPSLTSEIAAAVMKALAIDPKGRFASASEMADAFEAAAKRALVTAKRPEIAALVSRLVQPELERRARLVRAATPDPASTSVVMTEERDATVGPSSSDVTTPATAGKSQRRTAAVIFLACLLALGEWLIGRPSPAPPAPHAALAVQPSPHASTEGTTPQALAPSAGPSASAVEARVGGAPRVRKNRGLRSSASVAKPPSVSSGPTPEFENPYQ